MNTTSSKMKQNLKRLLAGAGLAVALPLAAFAQSGPQFAHMAGGPDGGRPHMHRMSMGGGMERGPGGFGHHGAGFLHGIDLTDAQRDKIFAIRHAAEPQVYEKFKLLRKSHEDLRGMATSPNYDEAKAKAAIDTGARAQADLALLRVRSEHEIFALLTPEQKAQVEKNRANFLQHRMSMGERGGPRAPGGERAPQK
jgi:Spy/CpxP family protein refolding chaperone